MREEWIRLRQPHLPFIRHKSLNRIKMSGLVGYGSSDEEDDIPPERPAKVGLCHF